VTAGTNLLVIVLDALREDAVVPALEVPGRCVKAETAIASAPWTLPSCTSLITGLDATRHHHYWHSGSLATSGLVGALPDGYRTVGLVNNTVLQPASQLDAGFDRWVYFDDHRRPFEQAAKLVRRARPRRPVFVLLHSNIAHDYYLPGAGAYYDEAFPEAVGGACALGARVISWNGTTPDERAAVAKTYGASARKAVSEATEILELARGRDDFVCAVVSDHGEGFDYDHGRLHHGGRVHDDLLRVPLYFDLPSTIPEGRRAELAAALASTPVAVTDVLPTLFSLVGVASLPDVDGRPIASEPDERVLMSEDRRYLYLHDRFRLNYMGRGKHMSTEDQERNRRLLAQLAGPPLVRSYRTKAAKLTVTALFHRFGEESPSQSRHAMVALGADLAGSPLLVLRPEGLFAFELFELDKDPDERHNILTAGDVGIDALLTSPWATAVTLPLGGDPGHGEVDLPTVLHGVEHLGAG
jgi:hypothetical protein